MHVRSHHPTIRRRPGSLGRRAFTLIEVLIVIALLLAIVGLVAVNVLGSKDEADIDLTRTQILNLEKAIDMFKLDMKRFPSEDEGLAVLWDQELVEDEQDLEKWKPYTQKPLPRDTWGNEWIYRFPGELRGEEFYDLISLGPDGEEGTEDDITNHDDLLEDEEMGSGLQTIPAG